MTDILTHVLTGYVLGTLLSFRYDWLRAHYVTVTMVGAILPDLTKVSLAIPSNAVGAFLGVDFDWFALHTPFGAILTAGIGAILVDDDHRRRAFALLLAGAATHFLLDALLMSPSRFSYVLLWPFEVVTLPLPMYILSSDRWPAVVAATAAGIVWFVQRTTTADG